MFDQEIFGQRLRAFRNEKHFTQKEVALKVGVSEQAVSKWEKGICLPDAYNLKLLGQVLHVSVDCLLDTEAPGSERVVETIRVGGAAFEIVERPETVFAGKMIYARDYPDPGAFHNAILEVSQSDRQRIWQRLADPILPLQDIHISVNFWRDEGSRAFGFVREVTTESQPEGVDVYKMPGSLFIRAYTDPATAQLLAKESCEIWELFAYIRNFVMPAHGFRMAENGAQEMEVYEAFDTGSPATGYAYMPVMRADV